MKRKKCGRFEFNDYQYEIRELLKLAQDEYDCAQSDLKDIMLLEQDYLHELENDLTIQEVTQVAWKLKKLRVKRRELKAKDRYMYKFIAEINNNYNQKTFNRMLNSSLMTYDDCEYKKRIENKEREETILS